MEISGGTITSGRYCDTFVSCYSLNVDQCWVSSKMQHGIGLAISAHLDKNGMKISKQKR